MVPSINLHVVLKMKKGGAVLAKESEGLKWAGVAISHLFTLGCCFTEMCVNYCSTYINVDLDFLGF